MSCFCWLSTRQSILKPYGQECSVHVLVMVDCPDRWGGKKKTCLVGSYHVNPHSRSNIHLTRMHTVDCLVLVREIVLNQISVSVWQGVSEEQSARGGAGGGVGLNTSPDPFSPPVWFQRPVKLHLTDDAPLQCVSGE